MLNQLYKVLFTFLFVFLLSFTCLGKQILPVDSIQDMRLNSLRNEIEQVVKRYKGLCAGLVLIHRDKPDWIEVTGGDSFVENNTVSENTIFRIASISKTFVALAILKLKEEGLISLDDKIKDIIPEIKFENPWEETHPVRIVHLLEHTTGWDEIHLVEKTHNQIPPVTLKEALEFHPHSRKSRWAPGSRMAYCNSGYAVAAYIVEKISGQTYEDYMDENIFKPLKFRHTTYFKDQQYNELAAETYNWEMEKVDYKHELYRPAAALNSTPKDMAQLLKMLLSRGKLDSVNLFKKESIIRMETLKSTPGAQAGLALGYGLGNYTSVYKGYTYHGHDGAMDGGLSQLAYLPEYGVGHVILLNANNSQAMQQINALIREFETEMLNKPQQLVYHGPIDIDAGYYVAINPRNQNLFYQDLLLAGIEKIEVHANAVSGSWLFPGPATVYYPVSPTQFTLGSTRKIGLVKAKDADEGDVLFTEKSVLKHISGFRVFSQLILLGLWIIMILGGLLGFVLLIILYAINRTKYEGIIRISLFPTLASLFILLTFVLQYAGFIHAFSKPTFISIGLLTSSIFFPVCAVISGFIIFQARNYKINIGIYYPYTLLVCLHILASIYLIYYGFIPLITWA